MCSYEDGADAFAALQRGEAVVDVFQRMRRVISSSSFSAPFEVSLREQREIARRAARRRSSTARSASRPSASPSGRRLPRSTLTLPSQHDLAAGAHRLDRRAARPPRCPPPRTRSPRRGRGQRADLPTRVVASGVDHVGRAEAAGRSSLRASTSTAMMRPAPASRAPWITLRPTAPQPITSDARPGGTCAAYGRTDPGHDAAADEAGAVERASPPGL